MEQRQILHQFQRSERNRLKLLACYPMLRLLVLMHKPIYRDDHELLVRSRSSLLVNRSNQRQKVQKVGAQCLSTFLAVDSFSYVHPFRENLFSENPVITSKRRKFSFFSNITIITSVLLVEKLLVFLLTSSNILSVACLEMFQKFLLLLNLVYNRKISF